MALDEFRSLEIQFVSLREAIDTSTPMGKAMFTIIAAMAELESALASGPSAAMEYARRHGTPSDRTFGRQRIVFRRDVALELGRQGKSYREISAHFGISVGTLQSAIQEYERKSGHGSDDGYI